MNSTCPTNPRLSSRRLMTKITLLLPCCDRSTPAWPDVTVRIHACNGAARVHASAAGLAEDRRACDITPSPKRLPAADV
ncbi:hypothetical protein SKAU_G00120490 [Synaphobranchus kaupii]|uniref:Uncharacterized protein n=1 Tax=Synaphobranchus kaupii TaxID=118154 RepID=A0A9Q1FP87_SYNKA|nr:hypothetical protein SKAU_G00120490 [Synaphobranchus kaupii]